MADNEAEEELFSMVQDTLKEGKDFFTTDEKKYFKKLLGRIKKSAT